jgi:hypothetical protein
VGLFYGGSQSPTTTSCPNTPVFTRGWGGQFSGYSGVGDAKGGVNNALLEVYVLRTTAQLTRSPTARPTQRPTGLPTARPTLRPTTRRPTRFPTAVPTQRPTAVIPCTRESGQRRVAAVCARAEAGLCGDLTAAPCAHTRADEQQPHLQPHHRHSRRERRASVVGTRFPDACRASHVEACWESCWRVWNCATFSWLSGKGHCLLYSVSVDTVFDTAYTSGTCDRNGTAPRINGLEVRAGLVAFDSLPASSTACRIVFFDSPFASLAEARQAVFVTSVSQNVQSTALRNAITTWTSQITARHMTVCARVVAQFQGTAVTAPFAVSYLWTPRPATTGMAGAGKVASLTLAANRAGASTCTWVYGSFGYAMNAYLGVHFQNPQSNVSARPPVVVW